MSLKPPPVLQPPVRHEHGQQPPPSATKSRGPLGAIGASLLAAFKFILPALKGAKFLLTGLTMFASMWFYSLRFGWWFALLFVLGILIHELGHVAASAFLGVPVSAPIFLPGVGALIVQKKWAQSAWGEALIGIGGPLGGTLAGMTLWGIYLVTGSGMFLGAAFFTFAINLFNMIPMFPLDGGRIVGAVSPYLWLFGLIALVGMAVTGFVTNPMIWLIVIFSVPHVWSGLKRGTADPVGGQITTTSQRVIMGVAYLALSGFLFVAMSATSTGMIEIPRTNRPAMHTGQAV